MTGLFVPFCACLVYASCVVMGLAYAKIFREAQGQESRMLAVEQFRTVVSQRVPDNSILSPHPAAPVEHSLTPVSIDSASNSKQVIY